ncbi:MAG: hypothetical protein IJL19_04435 [Clostridiales bacterium]|nr:hypothetical protein [Clostridiales bacterium]
MLSTVSSITGAVLERVIREIIDKPYGNIVNLWELAFCKFLLVFKEIIVSREA